MKDELPVPENGPYAVHPRTVAALDQLQAAHRDLKSIAEAELKGLGDAARLWEAADSVSFWRPLRRRRLVHEAKLQDQRIGLYDWGEKP